MHPGEDTHSSRSNFIGTEQENEESEDEDSQGTKVFDDQEADLVLDEAHWPYMIAEQKICAFTGSFLPRGFEGTLSSLDA